MISGSSGLLDDAGQHMVTCTVTQDLQPGFNPTVQSGSGVLEITGQRSGTSCVGPALVYIIIYTCIYIIFVICMNNGLFQY